VFEQMLSEIPPRAEILEVGCGPAVMWRDNRRRIPRDWRVRLTDLMPGMIAEARAALGDDKRFQFDVMDVQELDLPDASTDAVIANHMLYHVPDLPLGLRQIRRVLRPDGKLLASTNSEDHMLRMKELISQYMGEASPFDGHMPFSLENGQSLLQSVFAHIEKRSAKGELRVTDAEAVARYVLSVQGAPQKITGEKLRELRELVVAEIRARGAYVITTEAGMFVAR
jgi:ubiquinone/menaquinone biosynthesis C-methylase UbiE